MSGAPRIGGRRQRRRTAGCHGGRLELHRWQLRLGHRDHTVLGLRPGTPARFSTEFEHGVVPELSLGPDDARLLARLLWGVALRPPGTLVLVDRPFLVPAPLTGEPPVPILIACARRTPVDASAARALRTLLPLRAAPTGTVVLRTAGLDAALADLEGWYRDSRPRLAPGRRDAAHVAALSLRGGVAVLAGSPLALQDLALDVHWLSTGTTPEDYYRYCDVDWWHPNASTIRVWGEHARESAAGGVTRRAFLAEQEPGVPTGSFRDEVHERAGTCRSTCSTRAAADRYRGWAGVSPGRGTRTPAPGQRPRPPDRAALPGAVTAELAARGAAGAGVARLAPLLLACNAGLG